MEKGSSCRWRKKAIEGEDIKHFMDGGKIWQFLRVGKKAVGKVPELPFSS